ncbi:hypothetical protein IW262DRAFT_1476573 [Armillaria fumosa]|nr:hypothetical protein IW262DRAFT_1476573 [Armillaria fumosa]
MHVRGFQSTPKCLSRSCAKGAIPFSIAAPSAETQIEAGQNLAPATCGCALDDACSDNFIILDAFPDEKAGWKLPDEEIPWLKVPAFPATFEDSWKAYYERRQLPQLDSPVALLLQWPMSMFMCLRVLGIVEEAPKLDPPGVASDLLQLALGLNGGFTLKFGELALLLPSTDLELNFTSEEAHLCACSALMEGIVDNICSCAFECTAPGSLGAGTVQILLEGRTALYDPFNDPLFANDPPDAIIALRVNTGLAA